MDNQKFRHQAPESVVGSTLQFADYSRSSWLLVEIERQLASLPRELRAATLQEVEEHLRCSRAALEELGLDSATADQEAVALFGSPSAFVNQVLKTTVKPVAKARALYWLTAAIMVYVCSFGIFTYYNMPLLWLGVAIGGTPFIFLSWKARSFQWKGVGITGIATSLFLGLVMGFGWISMWDAGGMGESPRWQVTSLSKAMRAEHAKVQAAYKELDPIWQAYREGQEAVEHSRYYAKGSYVQFEPSDPNRFGDFSYSLLSTASYKDALESWKSYHKLYRGQLERIDFDASGSSAVDAASRQIFSLRPAGEGMAAGGIMTCFALLLNCLIALSRWIYDQLRRLPRRWAA